jgi:hypothetical protein
MDAVGRARLVDALRLSVILCVVISLIAVAFAVPSSVPNSQGSASDLSQGLAPAVSSLVPPDQPGPYSVGTWNTTYVDRYSTNVSVVVYYPATRNGDGAPADKVAAPYPLIDFTHGHLLYPPYTYYVSWGDQYASWGYVVAMPNFQSYDGLLTSDHGEMANSTLDLISAMATKNSSSTGYLKGMVNTDDTALSGHSLGGKISVLAEEYEEADHLTNVKAVETLAMANANSPSTFPQLDTITVPIQVQTGTLDAVAYPSQNSQVVYNGVVTPPKQFVNITGGNHYHYADVDPSFGELGDNTSTITRAQQIDIGAKYATAFFNYYLKGEVQYYTYLYGSYARADLASKVVAWNEYANIPPPPVPSKPLNLKAGSGNAQIALTWTPPTGNSSVPVTNYTIYRGRSSGTETFLTRIGNLTTYNDSGLANCGTYYYNVTATNSYGQGPSSKEISATTSCMVSFVETGLKAGVQWSVKLGYGSNSSTTNTITFVEPNGKYPFSVGAMTGLTASPASGNVTLSGVNATQAILFTANGTAVYKLSFYELGLPTGTSWSATVNSTTSSTTSTIVFNEPNGTYSYTVGSAPPYVAAPSSGSICICGANAAVHVNFTSNVNTLTSVAIAPASPTVGLVGQQIFTATPTCSSTCPGSGISYSWAITSTALGSLSGSGSTDTFTAGTAAGTVGIFVNATLGGTTVGTSTEITVTAPVVTLLSVTLAPNSPSVLSGRTVNFTATPTCSATCPGTIAYYWGLSSSALGSLAGSGTMVTLTAGTTAGTGGIFVNATFGGTTKGASTMMTVKALPITLDSIKLSPISPSVAQGKTQVFTVTPTCSATCPGTISYAWALSSGTLGALSGSGTTDTFTAGTAAGTVGLFVNATFNGTAQSASTVITVNGSSSIATLSGVSLSPVDVTLIAGGQQVFTATITCTNGGSEASCPSEAGYAWTVSNGDGNVSVTSDLSTTATFIAGNAAGTVTLTVTATLNGWAQTASANITITPTVTPVAPSPTSINYLMVGVIVAAVAAVAVVAFVLLLRRRGPGDDLSPPGSSPPPDGLQGPGPL